MFHTNWVLSLTTRLAAIILLLISVSQAPAQNPTTPPRDFSRIQSYSGTLQVTGSGTHTDAQGRDTTTERANVEVTITCLPAPPNCLVIPNGGAFLQGTINGPLNIEQEHVLNQPFGPPSTGIQRFNGAKTGPASISISPFQSALNTIDNSYGFQYDHTAQCQNTTNGAAAGTGLCMYGPKIPTGQSPQIGPSIVANLPLPAYGFTLSGALPNVSPQDPYNAAYDVRWNFQCDARNLTVPLHRQNSTLWRDDPYDHLTGETIWGQGCALTSLAMALSFAGYAHTPRTLNQFMIQTGVGYIRGGVHFANTVNRVSNGSMKFLAFRSSSTRDIEDVLCMGFPVIVGVDFNARGNPGHYIVVTGKQNSKLLINDPAYTDRTTLDAYPVFETRGFIAPRAFSPRKPTAFDTLANEGSIVLHSGSEDVELMLVDAAGNRAGYDPATGTVFEEIPGSVYFQESITNDQTTQRAVRGSRYLQIDRAAQGAYQLVVTGLRAAAAYSIAVDTYAQDGSAQQPVTIQGTAQIGAGATSLLYSSVAATTPQIGAPICAFVSGTIPNLGPAAATAALTVVAPPGCTWNATSDSGWILIPAGSTGNGNGTVNLQVLTNATNTIRTGKLRIAGVSYPITQRRTTQAFDDVAVAHPFFDAINLLLARQVTRGCATAPLKYCSDDSVTRGQMAAFLIRSLLGDNFTFTATPAFNDVPTTHPFFNYIQKLKELGITLGCTTTQYCPDEPVTRGQMAAFLMRAKFGLTTAFPYPATAYFRDSNGLHPFFNYIQKMRELGVTRGCSATDYCPETPVTRGQMAVFLMRGLFNEPGI